MERGRTRFELVLDGIRSIARLSGEVEREGAEPWWKWAKLIFGIVDSAKETEEISSLPAPSEKKKLEAPRTPDSPHKSSSDLDDEVPF